MIVDQLKLAWGGFFRPMLQRPRRLQVAALCHRTVDGQKQVLLITSRDTGRWILPKGWPIDGLDSPGAALQEAWEEAGVRKGRANARAIGTYDYDKRMPGGWSIPVETLVFAVAVEALEDDFPEADERYRTWASPQEAAGMVDEPELKDILLNF